MNGLKICGLTLLACACAQAVDIAPKTEVAMRAALDQAVYTLDVAKVTSLLAELETAHVRIELLPLLQKLNTTKSLARRWPAKVGAVVAGVVCSELLCRCLHPLGLLPKFKSCADAWQQGGRVPAHQRLMTFGMFAASTLCAYKGYKAWINPRIQRARKIARLLLNSSVTEVGSNADAVASQLSAIAVQCGTPIDELVSAKCN